MKKSIKFLSVPFATMLVLAGCGEENDEVKTRRFRKMKIKRKQILKQELKIMKNCLSLIRIFN